MTITDADRCWVRTWLFEQALPLWWTRGADLACGGFYDMLDIDGRPSVRSKRLLVQARQAFVYAEAGRLGWDGPWDKALAHGLDFILSAYLRPDGLYRATVDTTGAPIRDEADLYDQAFVLFAFANAYARTRAHCWQREARALLAALDTRLAHSIGGYEERRPCGLPLRSNPHMHLLEALLAWVDADGGADFAERAMAIRDLALERLIQPCNGVIAEEYDQNWHVLSSPEEVVCMPGHQFEWAYLLQRAGDLLGGVHGDVIRRMLHFGETRGVRGGRVILAANAIGAPLDTGARLWGQTERLRASLVLRDYLPGQGEDAAAESLSTIQSFLHGMPPGLWRERTDEGGRWLAEPSPASSLYHLIGGLTKLIERKSANSPMPHRARETGLASPHEVVWG